MEEKSEIREEENNQSEQFQDELETPNYNYKWMIALLLVGIIGSFVFRYITK